MIVERYIGAAPGASEARPLLESVSRELTRRARRRRDHDPGRSTTSSSTTFRRVWRWRRPDKPAFLFLDALDQLGDTDEGRRLVWLPRELPPNVRVVVSTLEDEKYQCYPALRAGGGRGFRRRRAAHEGRGTGDLGAGSAIVTKRGAHHEGSRVSSRSRRAFG